MGTAEGLFWRPFSDLGVVSAGEKPDMVRLRVAPNPGDGIFSVFLEEREPASLVILDGLGKVVLRRFMTGSTVVDLSAFPNGIYVAVVWAGGKSGRQTILKQ